MIVLVVVYCLSTDPARCIEQPDRSVAYGSVAACSMQAQMVAQRYLAAHPKWTVARWRCEVDKPAEDPA